MKKLMTAMLSLVVASTFTTKTAMADSRAAQKQTHQVAGAGGDVSGGGGDVSGGGGDVGGGGGDVGGGGGDVSGGSGSDWDGSVNQNSGDSTYAGSTGSTYHDSRSYCGRTLSILDEAQRRAANQYARHKDTPALARATLRKGIQEAIAYYNSNWRGHYSPLTVDALHRALQIDLAFNNDCGSGKGADICQPDRRALRFLAGYVSHVQQDILPLDRDYYIPYHERHCFGYACGRDWWEEYVSHYKEAATSLMGVYVGRGPDGEQPEALGNDTYELRVASMLFRWVAYDLQRDDMNRRFGCEIGALYSVSRELNVQLGSNSDDGIYYDDREAVLNARHMAHEIYNHMDNSCGRRW